MKARFETTEQEDDEAFDVLGDALMEAYRAGRARDPQAKPYPKDIWEKLLQILGIGEWEDDVSTSDPLLGD